MVHERHDGGALGDEQAVARAVQAEPLGPIGRLARPREQLLDLRVAVDERLPVEQRAEERIRVGEIAEEAECPTVGLGVEG